MRQMFEDEKGKLSNLRVMSFVTLFGFLAATGHMLWKNQVNIEVLGLYAICTFAPKLVQKFAER